MATLLEQSTLVNEGGPLADKVKAACLNTAIAVAFESPAAENHANRVKWAKSALLDPNAMFPRVLRYIVGAMKASPLVDITGASDATIQSHVDASLVVLADGS